MFWMFCSEGKGEELSRVTAPSGWEHPVMMVRVTPEGLPGELNQEDILRQSQGVLQALGSTSNRCRRTQRRLSGGLAVNRQPPLARWEPDMCFCWGLNFHHKNKSKKKPINVSKWQGSDSRKPGCLRKRTIDSGADGNFSDLKHQSLSWSRFPSVCLKSRPQTSALR